MDFLFYCLSPRCSLQLTSSLQAFQSTFSALILSPGNPAIRSSSYGQRFGLTCPGLTAYTHPFQPNQNSFTFISCFKDVELCAFLLFYPVKTYCLQKQFHVQSFWLQMSAFKIQQRLSNQTMQQGEEISFLCVGTILPKSQSFLCPKLSFLFSILMWINSPCYLVYPYLNKE